MRNIPRPHYMALGYCWALLLFFWYDCAESQPQTKPTRLGGTGDNHPQRCAMQWIISSFMGRRRANKSRRRRRRHGMGQGIWESQRRRRNDIKLAPFVSLIENSFGEFFEVRNSEPLHSGDTLARNWTREWTGLEARPTRQQTNYKIKL